MKSSPTIANAPGTLVDCGHTPPDLGPKLLAYALGVADLDTPEAVLDGLHAVSSAAFDLRVLGAFRLPRKVTDWNSMRIGRTVFLHHEAPEGWWEEWRTFAEHHNPIGYMMMRASIAPFTWTEGLQLLQPIGVDRGGYELGLKYHMRDGLACPVGGQWVVVFLSPKVLSKKLTQTARIMIFGAASFAAMRLEQMVGAVTDCSGGLAPRLTPRELAVLRLVAMGKPDKQVAKELMLGEETVRTHMKKAQAFAIGPMPLPKPYVSTSSHEPIKTQLRDRISSRGHASAVKCCVAADAHNTGTFWVIFARSRAPTGAPGYAQETDKLTKS